MISKNKGQDVLLHTLLTRLVARPRPSPLQAASGPVRLSAPLALALLANRQAAVTGAARMWWPSSSRFCPLVQLSCTGARKLGTIFPEISPWYKNRPRIVVVLSRIPSAKEHNPAALMARVCACARRMHSMHAARSDCRSGVATVDLVQPRTT